MLTFDEIIAAKKRLNGVAHRTPVLTSRQFNEQVGAEVFFKAENFQRAGAFKFRGAYNKIASLTDIERQRGVLAYSSGNHAQAVALAAKIFNIPAIIVMPQDAPEIKIKATRGYGAEVIFYDRYSESRNEIGQRICAERDLMLVPPFDDYLIMAGQGTTALELIEDVPDLDALVVCSSGCGLLAGCATAAKHLLPKIRVFGVEPEAGNDTWLSMQAGSRVEIPVPHTIADGLQQSSPGQLTFPIVQALVEEILLVSEAELVSTLTFLLERMKVLVEPSGAAAAAAVMHHKKDFAGQKIGVTLSGGNVDLKKLGAWLTHGFDS